MTESVQVATDVAWVDDANRSECYVMHLASGEVARLVGEARLIWLAAAAGEELSATGAEYVDALVAGGLLTRDARSTGH